MKPKEVFEFTAPNGADVVAVVVDVQQTEKIEIPFVKELVTPYLCYGQNRIFWFIWSEVEDYCLNEAGIQAGYEECGFAEDIPSKYLEKKLNVSYKIKVLVDYAVLPEYDKLIDEYYH